MSDVRLPKAIQEEVERAEAIEREIAAMLDPDSANTLEVEAPEELPVEEQEPPVEPPQDSLPLTDAPQDDPNSETWQSRYTVLQGKYTNEVPRYAEQLRELRQYAQSLEERLKEAPPEQKAPAALEEKYRQAAELFGEDLVQFTRDMAQAEADRRIGELKQSQKQVEQRLAQSENDRFFAQIDAAVPNWRTVDNDPSWLGWLQEYDPMLGAPRQAAIDQAVQTRDVHRVTHLFNTFLGAQNPTAVNTTPQPTRAQLEQVTPRVSGNASVAQSPQARIYTQADIAQLLDPRNFNRLTREQQVALDNDIDLAAREGRIAA
jgi:hypothetical protein